MRNSEPETIRSKFEALRPVLDERSTRLWAAAEALALARGGVSLISRVTGLSRTTIQAGIREIRQGSGQPAIGETLAIPRVRREGAGRKPLSYHDPRLAEDLDELIEPKGQERQSSSLRWTCKSTRDLAIELRQHGHSVGERKVAQLLQEMHYNLQSQGRSGAEANNERRYTQFHHINTEVRRFQDKGQPVVFVAMRTMMYEGMADSAEKQQLLDRGAEELHGNEAVSLPVPRSRDAEMLATARWTAARASSTADLTERTLYSWLERQSGCNALRQLLLLADSGRENSILGRMLRDRIGRLSHQAGLQVSVCHFPRGTCRWSNIEYHMLCRFFQSIENEPLLLHQVQLEAIGQRALDRGDGASFPDSPRAGMLPDASALPEQTAKPDISQWNYIVGDPIAQEQSNDK